MLQINFLMSAFYSKNVYSDNINVQSFYDFCDGCVITQLLSFY